MRKTFYKASQLLPAAAGASPRKNKLPASITDAGRFLLFFGRTRLFLRICVDNPIFRPLRLIPTNRKSFFQFTTAGTVAPHWLYCVEPPMARTRMLQSVA